MIFDKMDDFIQQLKAYGNTEAEAKRQAIAKYKKDIAEAEKEKQKKGAMLLAAMSGA
jgi:hypothetical protein